MNEPSSPEKFDLVIEAGHEEGQYWSDVWRYRELLYFLSWRDILVRYKQTALGIAWAIIRPLVTMIIFTVVFGRLAKMPSEGVPYPVLVFAGMLPWQLFATALSEASNSLIGNANLVAKIYFPRLLVPASSVVVCGVDFLINTGLLLGLMAWYGIAPTWHLLALPVFVALTFAAAMGAGLWLAALNVNYRDFRYVVPFLVQFGIYVSPVGFSSSIIPESWWLLYSLNPMAALIDGFRWSVLGANRPLDSTSLAIGCAVVVILLVSGLWFFRRTEKSFADTI